MSTPLLILPLAKDSKDLVFGKTLKIKSDQYIHVGLGETKSVEYASPVILDQNVLSTVVLQVLNVPGLHLAIKAINEDVVTVAVTGLSSNPTLLPNDLEIVALPVAIFRGREVVRYEDVVTPHPAPETLLENPPKKVTKRNKK